MMREARIVALLGTQHSLYTTSARLMTTRLYAMAGKGKRPIRPTRHSVRMLRIFQKVCEAVAFAHARGVIHRDLKPENIMVGPFGEVLVMDWGVAKVLGPGPAGEDSTSDDERSERHALEDADLIATLPLVAGPPGETSGGTVIGTPAYMPPEQAKGQTELLDERSDVYASRYFLLTAVRL
jgi:serine/threonine protein kinase